MVKYFPVVLVHYAQIIFFLFSYFMHFYVKIDFSQITYYLICRSFFLLCIYKLIPEMRNSDVRLFGNSTYWYISYGNTNNYNGE